MTKGVRTSEDLLCLPKRIQKHSPRTPRIPNSGRTMTDRCSHGVSLVLSRRGRHSLRTRPSTVNLLYKLLQSRSPRNTITTRDDSHGAAGPAVCDGQLCSQYGIVFPTCITRIVPPNEQRLETIVLENPFVTKDVQEMNAADRRFCYYYWYMTNVHSIRGKGNTRRVPPCLNNAIRNLNPSPDEFYVEYLDQAARLTRNTSNP